VGLLADPEYVTSEVVDWIPSGFPHMDTIFGGRGWPVGRVVELFGQEGSGKSALAHRAIAECQKQGGDALLLDYEAVTDKAQLLGVGVDSNRLIWGLPDTMEEGWDYIDTIAEARIGKEDCPPFVVVWDSLAMSPTAAEMTSNVETVSAQARVVSARMRRAAKKVQRARILLIFVNQIREQIRTGMRSFGDHSVTPTGKAVKFAATIRVDCRIAKQIKLSDRTVGLLVKSSTPKNKLAPPHQATYWALSFEGHQGASLALTACYVLQAAGKLRATRGKFVFRGEVDGDAYDYSLSRADWFRMFAEDAQFCKIATSVYVATVCGWKPTYT
jgi:recombination protein RecA